MKAPIPQYSDNTNTESLAWPKVSALVLGIIGFIVAVAGVLATPASPTLSELLNIAMYFTIWTNTAAAILFGAFVVLLGSNCRKSFDGNTQRKYPLLARLAMYLTTSLVLVAVAYWVLLAPLFAGSLWTFSNLATHLVTPVLFLVFTVTCLSPGLIRRNDIYLTAIIPLIYVIAVYVAYALGYRYTFAGGVSNAFPYFFLDYHQLGWSLVGGYILGIAAVVIGVGYLLFRIARRRASDKLTVARKAVSVFELK